MTILEAQTLVRHFYQLVNPGEEDRFLVEEALHYLIEETGDPDCMETLGGLYYEQQQFDLARKYYEMAAEDDSTYALLGLGYIWYYDRTGEKITYSNYDEYKASGSYIIVMQLQNPAAFGFDFASQTGYLYQGIIDTVLDY